MNEERLKIFVSAYACEPNLGSEIGVGWHWVLEMSKYFDLWVLTRKSNQSNIETWLIQNPLSHKINFIYYDLPQRLRFWKKGLRGVRTYYVLWQMLTNAIVKKTMEENQIEIFHLLTYGNALWPVSRFGQSKFFIWGPTGVGDYIPYEFSKHYGLKWQIIEFVRSLAMKTLPLNIGFRNRCKKAKLIFCKTEATRNSIPAKFRKKAILFTDVAVEPLDTTRYLQENNDPSEITKYLSVGRLDAWRGFDLLIEAFAKVIEKTKNVRLEIIGNGSDRERLRSLITRNHLENYVMLTGHVSKEEYYSKMAQCDVVVNPCLKEGGVTTAFDSMSFCKPLICIDTGGYTHYFSSDYAEIIPRTTRNEVINNLYKAIIKLWDIDVRTIKGKKALNAASLYTWEEKSKKIYTNIVNFYNNY
ncbi:MAG: Alpha-D-kanosaminyltransferase [Bacteroidetes bacterium ADurb.Bin234]|nr:MAG: Alpha-D-kanosaminyltransferase [Bacteroidetes bacterium ADurb.Bin234]